MFSFDLLQGSRVWYASMPPVRGFVRVRVHARECLEEMCASKHVCKQACVQASMCASTQYRGTDMPRGTCGMTAHVQENIVRAATVHRKYGTPLLLMLLEARNAVFAIQVHPCARACPCVPCACMCACGRA